MRELPHVNDERWAVMPQLEEKARERLSSQVLTKSQTNPGDLLTVLVSQGCSRGINIS